MERDLEITLPQPLAVCRLIKVDAGTVGEVDVDPDAEMPAWAPLHHEVVVRPLVYRVVPERHVLNGESAF